MYPTEGAVDTAAVKMTQMLGVFLAGLGLASVVMRPAELDQSDLITIRDGITSEISKLNTSVGTVNQSVVSNTTAISELSAVVSNFDVSSLESAVSSIVSQSESVSSVVSDFRDLVESLDLSVDVDLEPVIDRVLSTHGLEMARLLEIVQLISAIQVNQQEGNSTLKSSLVDKIADLRNEVRLDLDEVVVHIRNEIQALDVEVDLTPVLAAVNEVDGVVQSHRHSFDLFINTLAGEEA